MSVCPKLFPINNTDPGLIINVVVSSPFGLAFVGTELCICIGREESSPTTFTGTLNRPVSFPH